MGTKVQFENYLPAHYSMKALTRESNGANWPTCFGESNLSNGQFYYGFLPRTVADSQPGYDKDIVKQTMLEHEAIFKDQVSELHRLYRVQRDLMDEARRKEQFKRRIPYETSSSSSPVPSQMQYEDVQRWNGPNLPLSNEVCGRPPISAPDTVQSSPLSAKGKSIQASPSSLPNCYSPKNSESESRPTKLRRRMLDLQLPADEYIDTDEVDQFNGVKVSDNTSPSPDKNRKFAVGNGKRLMDYPAKTEYQGDTSRSNLHVSKPRALADLNEPLLMEEATSVSSIDFLRRGGSHIDVQYRDLSARLLRSSNDVPQNPKNNGSMNGALNNVHLEHRSNGADWFGTLEQDNKGSIRSINQGICPEKAPVPSQPVHIMLDQVCQPPAFLASDRVKGDLWKAKSGGIVEKSDRGYSLSSYNVPGTGASHLPNQPGFFQPWDQCTSSWGKPGSFFGQKPIPVQTSPYPTSATLSKSPQSSAQSNDLFGNNKWNLNSSPSALGTDTPVRNGFYEGSSYSYKGTDYANGSYSEKKVPCSSINYFKATSCSNMNPVKDMNLNVALPNGMSDDHYSRQGVRISDKEYRSEDPVAVLPWLRGKGACNNEAENSRKGLYSLDSALSRWGSVASNSCEGDVKAKVLDSSRKILGVPIFENPPTPKKEISNPLLSHKCSGNKESERSGRKGGFDMNLPCDPTEEEVVIVEENIQTESASLRHHFDLNSCIFEEEIPSETPLPENKTSLRNCTGIDLEAPFILEDEEVIPPDEDSLIKETEKEPELPQHNAGDGEAELAKSAAVAIVAISSFVNPNQSKEATFLQVETDLDDPLQWFVDIACSNGSDLENVDGVPEDLDDFELMTLRQKECTAEESFPKPSFPEVPNIEEKGACVLTTTRARKGHGRRGRQRRDFQRDILPGLTSLARHEVTEDLQMFGGLMRATGHPWQSGLNRRNATRSGGARGRRRSVAAAPTPTPTPAAATANAVCALPLKQQQQQHLQNSNTEVVLEDRSLTGWGKTTRRPRRQRCPAGNPASAPPPVPLT
ncbi:uncharacterized protein LOC110722325 [Chenopodium quinoa]|uniref:uncharacterized protein LOC110722325 n=1 Tax=Chenopodium quinoa TaxID=63459 RepID=UPI000B79A725|nr:uncharacterized protein LOC110722325 [Chenopodium quinoa]